MSPSGTSAPRLHRSSTIDEVASLLRADIVSGELAPGTQLREVALAESIGVSRPSLREALQVLRQEGLRVVLVNSNPATIMTDPEFADATYVEPITPEFVAKVIEKERPDVLLATLGGQTALNCAVALDAAGVLEKYGVELIGASIEAIDRGENRESFKKIVEELGGEVAQSVITAAELFK